MNQEQSYQTILAMAGMQGFLRMRDMQAAGIHPEFVRRLCSAGKLQRIARGIYSLPDIDITAYHSYALAAKAVPNGIICLLSALRFYQLTAESPSEVWVAIEHKSRLPSRKDAIPMRFIRYSGKRLTEGVEEHIIEKIPVRIYSIAKTVADCFVFRHRIGLDVALQALKECLQNKSCSAEELWHYAKICRVAKIMRPYMEAIAI